MAWDLLTINSGGTVTRYRNFTTNVVKTVATSGTADVAWDGENLLVCSATTIYKYQGLSTTILSSIVAPGTACTGITWDGENLISYDQTTNKIYVYRGFSTTIVNQFAPPATGGNTVYCLGFDLDNDYILYTVRGGNDRVYRCTTAGVQVGTFLDIASIYGAAWDEEVDDLFFTQSGTADAVSLSTGFATGPIKSTISVLNLRGCCKMTLAEKTPPLDISSTKFDIRRDPFTGTDDSIWVNREWYRIPLFSPFYITTNEVPRQESPTSVILSLADYLRREIASGDTVITVVNGGSWAAGNVLDIESEQVYVSSVNGDDLTVTRGYAGTTPAAHAELTMIYKHGESAWNEVAALPSAGEYQVNYGTDSVPYKRGMVRFNSADAGKIVVVSYWKTGSYSWAKIINDLQSALGSATGDHGDGVQTFIDLNDTPVSYTGQGGKFVKVNPGATALEFGSGSASPLTTKGDLFTRDASADARLPVGTNGKALAANSATATGLEWVSPVTVGVDPIWDTAGDLAVGTGPDTAVKLPVGTSGFILVSDSGVGSVKMAWKDPVSANIVIQSTLTTKGDLFAATAAATITRQGVGTNGQFLTADSGQAAGLAWSSQKTVATDPLWDALGDLAIGSGADTAARLAVGGNGNLLRARSAAAAGVEWSPPGWNNVAPGTVASDTTFTVTDNAENQRVFAPGRPLRFGATGHSTWYYAIVTTYAAGTVTIRGASYTTARDDEMQYGDYSMAFFVQFVVRGTWSTAVSDTVLLSKEKTSVYWALPAAFCVGVSHKVVLDDTGASQPRANLLIAANPVSNTSTGAGRTASTSWIHTTDDVYVSNYRAAYGNAIEVRTGAEGTNDNSEDLTIVGLFILEGEKN